MVSASTKPEFSGIKSHKLISSVFERKCSSDYESAWSPTSPLDFRLFSSLRNPFGGDSSFRSIWSGKQKSWDSGKVGLSIVDSLDDHQIDSSRILLPSPDSKKMIFGSFMRPHLPNPIMHKHNAAFEIGHDVVELQSSGSFDRYCSNTGNISVKNSDFLEMKQTSRSLTGHIESDTEDYTCVIAHGPNPRTTHFYSDQVLKSIEFNELKNKKEGIFEIVPLDLATTPIEVLPPKDFLKFCWFCNNKLDMGKDIYMYRGYKAFCSSECRLEEINQDEEEEEEDNSSIFRRRVIV